MDTNLPDRPVGSETEARLGGFSDDAGYVLPEAEGGGAATCRPSILDLPPFTEIWAVDFEFGANPGENPEPVCLVAWELSSGRKLRLWRDEFGPAPPYPISADVLFVAYYASAEIGCHLALGWPVPERVLDLFTEFRNHTNGIPTVSGPGLLGALAHYGLDSIGTIEKDEMRDLILRGGPWTDAEREAILNYCESDVEALARLQSTATRTGTWMTVAPRCGSASWN